MVALLDDLGTWQELGVVIPQLGQFTSFGLAATSGFNTFRVIWEGFTPDVQTFCFLRSYFIRGGSIVTEGKWQKLYPKIGEEILFLEFSPEFQLQQLERYFEVEKWAKWYKFNRGFTDPNYQLRLLEFIPYPETIAAIQETALQPQAIDQITASVIESLRLNFDLPEQPQLPPPPP